MDHGIDYSSLTMQTWSQDAQDPKVSSCCITWNKAVLVVSNVTQRSFETYIRVFSMAFLLKQMLVNNSQMKVDKLRLVNYILQVKLS